VLLSVSGLDGLAPTDHCAHLFAHGPHARALRNLFRAPLFRRTFAASFLGGLLGALLGGLLGFWVAQSGDPSGWSQLPDTLQGSIYGYGLGAGAGAFMLHMRPHAPSAFSRAFLGALSGLFAVIFFSAPLHLDIVPFLMWGLLILLPPLIAARLLMPRRAWIGHDDI
ncbi:MAG: hypothetical protein L3J16_05520, partial [Anaerolineales bacterium]|nr:hypothetical protein [Anaerolineales bacterium]